MPFSLSRSFACPVHAVSERGRETIPEPAPVQEILMPWQLALLSRRVVSEHKTATSLLTIGPRFLRLALMLAAIAALSLGTAKVQAQSAYYGGVINVAGSGFGCPYGTAVDAGGDVFVADPCNEAAYEIEAVN